MTTAKEKLQKLLDKRRRSVVPELEPVAKDGAGMPLSYGQQRLWFLNQLVGPNSIYNIPLYLRLKGKIDTEILRRSLEEVFRRHESLRTRFFEANGEVCQRAEPLSSLGLPVEAVSSSEALQQIFRNERYYRFDLERDRPCRVRLLRDERDGSHLLLITMHHSIADGWSVGILVRELFSTYAAFAAGRASPLEALPISYSDYAHWQRQWLQGEVLEEKMAYWREDLADLPAVLDLPLDRKRPAQQTYRGNLLPIEISGPVYARLQELGRRYNATLYMILLAAFFILLSKYSGQKDLAVGTPIAGRTRKETERLIGFFVNTLVMRCDLAGDPTFAAVLRQVRERSLAGYEHQDIPFEKLVEELNPDRSLGRSPLFQVMFALHGEAFEPPQLVDIDVETVSLEEQCGGSPEGRTSRFELTFNLEETSEAVRGVVEYNCDLFDEETIEAMVSQYEELLQAASASPEKRISELSLLGEAERTRLLSDWNDTDKGYPDEDCIHWQFERQVAEKPDATALVFGDEHLSFAELNRRANRLAQYLVERGVEPETGVGLCTERSLEMVIGIYAIVKAGGYYVPLDPDLPESRLAYQVEDSGVKLILTHSALRERLGFDAIVGAGGESLDHGSSCCIDIDGDALAANGSDENPQGALSASNLAYVIYTSGSTGRPKGVATSHRALVNRIDWMQKQYCIGENDRVLQKTPFGFDVSVWEFFWPLTAGGCLVLAVPGGHRDPTYLQDVVDREQISILHFVPSMLTAFLAVTGWKGCRSVRQVVCSGEALSTELEERFFRAGADAKLDNLYGPTEAAIDVSYWGCSPESGYSSVPIGKPIQNIRLYVLDSSMNPVPVGCTGELFIGGVGLARGYVAKPGMTAERFVPNPFCTGAGERLYRTGDLVRYFRDGNIEYQGRADHQVKIRGFRIELGEIERVLSRQSCIQEAVVTACQVVANEDALAAYAVIDGKFAPAAKRITAMLEQEEIDEGDIFTLPNGMDVCGLNGQETHFGYQEIFARKCYEQHGISIRDGDCVFDVGANIGLFSVYLRTKASRCRIHAFEPIAPIYDILERNSRIYGEENIVTHCLGLSDAPRRTEFDFYPNDSLISGISKDDSGVIETVKGYLLAELKQRDPDGTIDASSLDELVKERLSKRSIEVSLSTISEQMRLHDIESIDLLKIDVERSELDVLKGIEDTDWPKIKQIVVEVHDIDNALAEVEDMLTERGYTIVIDKDEALQETALYNVYARRRVDEGTAAETPSDDVSWMGPSALRAEITAHLRQQLPDYMVPGWLTFLSCFPLTSSGKVDRRKLPAPDVRPDRRDEDAAPVGAVEQTIAGIWSAVLKRPDIGRFDKFFEVGGHSLLATQLLSRIREAFSVDLGMQVVFENQTVREQARAVESALQERVAADTAIAKCSSEAPRRLSFAQERLWFLNKYMEPNAVYNLPLAIRIEGNLDVAALMTALREIVRRHEVLRTRFGDDEGEAVQLVDDDFPDLTIEAVASRDRLMAICRAEINHPFDLSKDSLCRIRLLREEGGSGDADAHVLLVTMHHSVSDAWSQGIFFRELVSLYTAFSRGEPSRLQDLPIQYGDYAEWQRRWLTGDVLRSQLAYWRNQLAGLPALLALPTDRPRPAAQTFRGGLEAIAISPSLTAKLRALSNRQGVTLFMTLLAGFSVLLSRYAGQKDVAIGTPVANRTRRETEELIGFFVNTLVMRADLRNDPEFLEVLADIRATAVQAYGNQDVPFEKLVEELNPERDPGHSPLFQVFFSLENVPMDRVALPGLELSPVDLGQGDSEDENGAGIYAHFDITLLLRETDDGLAGAMKYNADLFDRTTIRRMLRCFSTLLESIVDAPATRISRLRLVDEPELRQIRVENKDGAGRSAPSLLVHELFERRARECAHAIALTDENGPVTYGELDSRANKVARYLVERNVGPEVRVGICGHPSADTLASVLATLKVGAACVLVPPEYAAQRKAWIVEANDVRLILTQPEDGAFSPGHVRSVEPECTPVARVLRGVPVDRLSCAAVHPENLAWVCNDAESRGVPLGAELSYSGLTSMLVGSDMAPRVGNHDPRLLPGGFDGRVLEILRSLLGGGTAVIGGAGVDTSAPEPIAGGELPGEFYILDHALQVVPRGVFGELCVASDAVPRALRGRPADTAERLVPNPYGSAGGRLYRSGERVRQHNDGSLEYADRVRRDQAGIGSRTRLKAMEGSLRRHPEVSEAVVVRTRDSAQQDIVVAYVVPREGIEEADADAWNLHIFETLKRHKRPSLLPDHVVLLSSLPVTEDGSVDERSLPPAEVGRDSEPVPPETETEKRLLTIWQERLGRERIGVDDNYFALGGDSIRSIALVAACNKQGLPLSIKDLFTFPTVRELGRLIDRGESDSTTERVIAPYALLNDTERRHLARSYDIDALEDAYPLSMIQQGMVMHALKQDGLPLYQNFHVYEFEGEWHRELFEESLKHLMQKHPMLRCIYDLSLNRPLQLVLKRMNPDIEVVDLSGMEDSEQRASMEAWMDSRQEQGIDTARALWRLSVHILAPDRFLFCMFIHHAQWDGWSLETFATELYSTYGRLRAGLAPETYDLLPSYNQFVAMESEAAVSESHRNYWRDKLRGASVPWWTRHAKTATANIFVDVSNESSHRLSTLARSLGVQEKSLWCAVYLALLAVLDGRDDIVGPVINQGRPEVSGGERMVGPFLNPLPLRMSVRGKTWKDLIVATDRELRQQHAFRHYPLAEMQQLTGLDFSAVLFTYANWHVYYEGPESRPRKIGDGDPHELELRVQVPKKVIGRQETNYLMDVYVSKDEKSRQFSMLINADAGVFDASMQHQIRSCVGRIIRQLEVEPSATIEKEKLIDGHELATVRDRRNDTARSWNVQRFMHELFEERAAENPSACALIFENDRMSYGELNERANRLAHFLLAQGLCADQRVGICMERAPEMVVAILGVLKAGGCYVPLDPGSPDDRLEYMVQHSDCRLFLTQSHLVEDLDFLSGVRALPVDLEILDELLKDSSRENIEPRAVRLSSTHLAYMIYTSGSTGRPKAVQVHHSGLTNYLLHAAEAYFGEARGAVVGTSLSFDATVTSLLTPLICGGYVHLLKQGSQELEMLQQVLFGAEEDLVFKVTPAHLEAVQQEAEEGSGCDRRHVVVVGGEQFTSRLLARWLRLMPKATFVNEYGPTETVVGCSVYSVSSQRASVPDRHAVPIGRPIGNSTLYVVDGNWNCVPVGVPGELLVGGEGVVRGYSDEPGLTAAKFIPDHFARKPGRRLYRTGDLVRWTADGELEFIGRVDNQIKLRGIRIELGEIEGILRAHERVKDICVLARDDGERNIGLVAYVVFWNDVGDESRSDESQAALVNELRAYALKRLPTYMMISSFAVLDALPMTSNGKIDRNALLSADHAGFDTEYLAPRNEVEMKLCEFWQELLKVEQVGIRDNFWSLGGQSLLALRLSNMIRNEFGVEVQLKNLFENAVIEALSEFITTELDAVRYARLSIPVEGEGVELEEGVL